MNTEELALVPIFLYAFLFFVGFFSFFYTKKVRGWYINLLNALHKKKMAFLYEFYLNMLNKKWFIINLKIWGLVVMLVFMFLLIISIRGQIN